MHIEERIYYHDETPCHGFLAYNTELEGKRPAVLVTHAWRGQDEFAREKAKQLAELGYVGMALDVYGEGKYTDNNEEAPFLMAPFFLDRALMQGRMLAALASAKEHQIVDENRIAAIGYCFGGLCVYELLRSGADMQGCVSFHGVFAEEREGQRAKTTPLSSNARGKLLVLHGHEDPMVSDEDLKRVQNEMTKAHVDWQIHIFGHTMHAFTNPQASNPEMGIVYNEQSEKRSWRMMQDFFDEIF